MKDWDFNERAAIVVWEMTRACRLACIHCRASAQSRRDPRELTTEEGRRLLDSIAATKPMLLILTGGDPSRREDLLPLIAYATGLGLRVAFSPSATPDLLNLDFAALRDAGVCRVSLSLDGATAATHNDFRGVPRAWEWTMEAIERLRTTGLGLQINTSISARNFGEFPALCERVREISPEGWTIFLVVPTGRGERELLPQAGEVEKMLGELLVFAREVPFEVRTTEAQHYRRIIAQNADGGKPLQVPVGINDGKGFVFVSHIGEVCPSGFLPVVAGNVREADFGSIYREAPILRQLRDADLLKGKCGRCPYKQVCGGSRARAYALTGDYLAEESLCDFLPFFIYPPAQRAGRLHSDKWQL